MMNARSFLISGGVSPLLPMNKGTAVDMRSVRSRPMGGWLMTYGKLGPDGGIVPTVDRDDHIFEAASELGKIDWSPFITSGVWNDNHSPVAVGIPWSLEFHDGTTALSQSHRKVGFWTTGWLFDRRDPESWRGLVDEGGNARRPTREEFDRADYYYECAQSLAGTPRPIGFSAEGDMVVSPCRTRIVWARVRKASLCDLPRNPDSTTELLLKGSPLEGLRKGMIGRGPCGRCSCPPEERCEALMKGGTSPAEYVPGGNGDWTMPTGNAARLEKWRRAMAPRMMALWRISENDALAVLDLYIKSCGGSHGDGP